MTIKYGLDLGKRARKEIVIRIKPTDEHSARIVPAFLNSCGLTGVVFAVIAICDQWRIFLSQRSNPNVAVACVEQRQFGQTVLKGSACQCQGQVLYAPLHRYAYTEFGLFGRR